MNFLIENLDTVVKLLLISIGAISFFYALKGEISSLRIDIKYVKDNQKLLQEAFNQLNGILTKVAVQDTRLNMLEKKIDELSHGQGFVK